MPWKIKEQEGQYCVMAEDTGETVKCHDSEEKAMARANKNVLGLAPLGNSPAGIAAFLADRWTGGQAALARLLYQMGNPKAARAVITSAGAGQIQEPDYSE